MLKSETIEFIRAIPPFTFLDLGQVEGIAEDIALEYYPKGARILVQDGPPSDSLRIIRKGGVKVTVTAEDGEEMVLDYRTERELFGLVSALSGDRSRANIVAVEDTTCYLVPREKVIELVQKNPAVNEYFLKSFFINFIDKSYDETRRRSTAAYDTDRRLFTTSVREIVTRKPVTGAQGITIREAAGIMAREKVSSLVLVDEAAAAPVGIVTDRDLREKVVARGRDVDEPVSLIMSAPIIRVDADEFCFEALLRMIRYKIHHILVVDGGRFMGVVTNHDFMVLQGASPTVLVREMEGIERPEDIGGKLPMLHKAVATLLREGARARNVAGLITELLEKLIERTLSVLERGHGAPPVPYALFIYGDGARRELSLNPRLKLGIAFDASAGAAATLGARKYFEPFVADLASALEAGGLGIEAAPITMERCRSYAEWREEFQAWAANPVRHAPDLDMIEMRAVAGDEEAVGGLRETLFGLAVQSGEFMNYAVQGTARDRPPLGFFRQFVVEKTGEHRNELNLYNRGVRPAASSLRVLALESGIREMQSLSRADVLAKRHALAGREDVARAFDYLYTLLLHHQVEQVERGEIPDDFINPGRLGMLERRTLKESFQLIADLCGAADKFHGQDRGGTGGR